MNKKVNPFVLQSWDEVIVTQQILCNMYKNYQYLQKLIYILLFSQYPTGFK